MRIPRIYLSLDLNNHSLQELTELTELTGHAFQHVVKVLRMKENSKLIIFDGNGHEYNATLQQVNKKNAFIKTESFINNKTESNLMIHLGLAISKGERMDFAIQKAVELGVTEITPLFTEYCIVNLKEKRMQKRLQHWQGIIISACEQSGRSLLPIINTAMTLTKWSESIDTICLVFDPLATRSLKEIKYQDDCINLVIGPEGGFSSKEITELSEKENYYTVKFGPRVLRTETAAISAITAIQLLWGDLLK